MINIAALHPEAGHHDSSRPNSQTGRINDPESVRRKVDDDDEEEEEVQLLSAPPHRWCMLPVVLVT